MTDEQREMVRYVIRAWGNLEEVAAFALARQGYGTTNIFCGVSYPHEQDPHDLAAGDTPIPTGHVEVYADDLGYSVSELRIKEEDYIIELTTLLEMRGLNTLTHRLLHSTTKR